MSSLHVLVHSRLQQPVGLLLGEGGKTFPATGGEFRQADAREKSNGHRYEYIRLPLRWQDVMHDNPHEKRTHNQEGNSTEQRGCRSVCFRGGGHAGLLSRMATNVGEGPSEPYVAFWQQSKQSRDIPRFVSEKPVGLYAF